MTGLEKEALPQQGNSTCHALALHKFAMMSKRNRRENEIVATYMELKAELAALTEKAEAARAAEFHQILAEIRAKVVEYGITEKDIFGVRRGRQGRTSAHPVAVKYRDPDTGATWSGRGRAPQWIKGAKNRDRFLVTG